MSQVATVLWSAVFIEHMLGLSMRWKLGASVFVTALFIVLLCLLEAELAGSAEKSLIPVTIVTGNYLFARVQ